MRRFLVGFVLVCLLAPVGSLADTLTVADATLPGGRFSTSAVWTGQEAFVFGGSVTGGARTDEIVRYDPISDTTSVMNGRLPTPRALTSAVWDGRYAYVFGGSGGSPAIVRYDPATDVVTMTGASLPSTPVFSSAIWNGQHAYVFGGQGSRQIVRYDPASNVVTVMSAMLPTVLAETSAVWDGTHAYIFGGREGTVANSNRILRYDPQTDTIATMNAVLPTARGRTSAVWDGWNAFIFGGSEFAAAHQILRYHPASDTVTVMSATIPFRYDTSAIWDGENAYVFGGYGAYPYYRPEILRYGPQPGPAQGVSAAAGPGYGEVTLQWQPPAGNTYSTISGYLIYRRSQDEPEVAVGSVGEVLSFTDGGLQGTTTYFYRIRATGPSGPGAYSSEASATTFDPCEIVTCVAEDQCHVAGLCDPKTGLCSSPAKPDDTPCDDGDACTLDDTCQAGVCEAGGPTLLSPLADPGQTAQCIEETVDGALP